MSNELIFSSFKLKNHILKNRIGLAPMTRMSSKKDSVPRQDVLDFLVTRAENGAAVVYTEAIVTDYESAQGYPGQARMLTQRQIDAWKPVVDKIKAAGALPVLQIFHCGRMAWPEVNPAQRVIAPSPVAPAQDNPLTEKPYSIPDEMTPFDIQHVINGFAETAKGAVEAGFDGIEIHGAHGYLISQFLSTYSNKRTDGYGGAAENRFKFAHEVIQAVKAVIPDETLLLFRISNWGVADMEVSLFEDQTDYQTMIQLLSKEPVDAISVSTYKFSDEAFGTGKTMAALTREATPLPIFVCGQIHDGKTAVQALKDADMVLSAKSLLLNPDWVEDVRNGKELKRYDSSDAMVAYTEDPLP